ncbi:putative capsid protein [Freshwater macrophyte associated tombus-like virus 3]|nr:putative capsid protein [Freshwater macrophyte associated tombus-like virus 3]
MAPANKMNKRKNSRKQNPTQRALSRVPRPRVSFDGTLLRAVNSIQANITNVDGQTLDYHTIDCNQVLGIARTQTAVINAYQKYRFRKVTVEWIPMVAPGEADARTRVGMCYIDNPENMYTMLRQINVVTVAGFVNRVRNMKQWNVWERFTFNVPLTQRRKWFAVNTAVEPIADSNQPLWHSQLDLNTQGVICSYITGAPNRVMGVYRVSYDIELSGLAPNTGT